MPRCFPTLRFSNTIDMTILMFIQHCSRHTPANSFKISLKKCTVRIEKLAPYLSVSKHIRARTYIPTARLLDRSTDVHTYVRTANNVPTDQPTYRPIKKPTNRLTDTDRPTSQRKYNEIILNEHILYTCNTQMIIFVS